MPTYTWLGGNNVSWSQANNWSPSGLPTASDDVIFSTSNNPCTVFQPVNCRSLTINSGYTSTITLNDNIQVGAVTGSGIAPVPLYTSYPALVINGAPTFVSNTGSVYVFSNVEGAVLGVSSSTATSIPLMLRAGSNGNPLIESSIIFSGSVLLSHLRINGAVRRIGGAQGSTIILSGSIASPGFFDGPNLGNIFSLAPSSSGNPTYVPPIICSGSISWRYGSTLPLPLSIANGCTFRYTGSSTPETYTGNNGIYTTFNPGGKTFYTTANPLNINVDAGATLLCHPSSALFLGQSGHFAIHMSGSTTNKWNSLRMFFSNLQITSDLWLEQNQTLTPNNLISASNRPYQIGCISTTTSYITGSAGRTIYAGGDLASLPYALPSLNYPAGPRVVMYGAGYIGGIQPNLINSPGATINIDLVISSSKDIAWGVPGNPSSGYSGIQSGLNLATAGAITYITASSWTAYSSSFLLGSGTIDLKENPVWDMRAGQNVTNTFSSSIVCSGSLSAVGSARINSSSGTNPIIYVHRNVESVFFLGNYGGISSGSMPIHMIGNLPATYSLVISPSAKCPDITINKPGGSILIKNDTSGNPSAPTRNLVYGNGTFKYIAGTVNAGTSTMDLVGTASMDTAGSSIPWYNITVSGSGTGTARGTLVNIISPLTITNELNLGVTGNVTFTGSNTWTCSRLVCTTPNRTITLQDAVSNGQKAYVTTNFVNLSSSGTPISMSSNSLTTRASWSFTSTPSNVFNVSGIRIDSSNGNTIWTTGVTQSTVNWNIGSQPLASLFTFFID